MERTSKNEEFLARLSQVECHDSTCHKTKPPLVINKGQGSYVWDVDSNRYVDLCAGFGSLPFGHNFLEFRSVFEESLRDNRPILMQGLGDVYPHKRKVEFLEILIELMPPHLEKAALAVTGGQAVELAMKSAMIHTKKEGFIVFDDCYHGLDFGSLALTQRDDFREPFQGWLNTSKVKSLPFGCSLDTIARAIEELNDKGFGVAGVLVEPVQGRGGVKGADPRWLQGLHDLCKEENTLLIFDEVFVGVGRCGNFSFTELVPADLTCLGKALGGGMPLSAVVGTRVVMDSWPESKGEALHTGTFFGHPLSLSMGLKVLQKIQLENTALHNKSRGAEILALLKENLGDLSVVKDIRGYGMMLAVEFIEAGLGAKVYDDVRSRGVILLPSGTEAQCISITPAYNINDEDIKNAVSMIRTSIESLT